MIYAKLMAIIFIWTVPLLIISITRDVIFGSIFIGSLVGTEYIISWKEDDKMSLDTDNISNNRGNEITDEK